MVKDYLGTPIKIGDRGIRVHSYSHYKSFKKVTVKEINTEREHGDSVGIITDGNSRKNRLISSGIEYGKIQLTRRR